MNAYSYNDEMEYTGPVACQIDPVRSKKDGRDVWLLPANATMTPPPDFSPDTHKAVWNGSEWTLEDIPEPEPEPAPDPAPTTEDRVAALEAENKTLKAQVSALTDQNDFQEELIVELAGVVYA